MSSEIVAADPTRLALLADLPFQGRYYQSLLRLYATALPARGGFQTRPHPIVDWRDAAQVKRRELVTLLGVGRDRPLSPAW